MERYVKELSGNILSEHYPSMLDALECVHAAIKPVGGTMSRSNLLNTVNSGGEWKTAGYWFAMRHQTSTAELCTKIVDGKRVELLYDTSSIVRQLEARIENTGESRRIEQPRRRRIRTDMGDELDRHAALAGRHDTAWTTTRRMMVRDHRPRLATLNVEVCNNADIDARDCVYRTAVAGYLVNVLQRAGFAVEIIASAAVRRPFYSGASAFTVSVQAKGYLHPMNLETVEFLTSAAYFRSIFFALIGANSAKHEVSPGIGHAAAIDSHHVAERKASGSLVITIPAYILNMNRAIGACQDAIKQINEYRQPAQAA